MFGRKVVTGLLGALAIGTGEAVSRVANVRLVALLETPRTTERQTVRPSVWGYALH